MELTIPKAESEILNALLEYIPFKKEFDIKDLHVENALKRTYVNNSGEVDNPRVQEIAEHYRRDGIYENLENILVNSLLAEKSKAGLLLTKRGEYLQAYGDYERFWYADNRTFQDEDIEIKLPILLPTMSWHGEFTIDLPYTYKTYDTIPVIYRNPNMVKEHENVIECEAIMLYMVDRGFAINRHDIKVPNELFHQLTDKGRKLRELGSVQSFMDWENSEREKQRIREEEADELRKSNIATGKIQLSLQELQTSLLLLNRWIVVATFLAALSSLGLLVSEILKHFGWVGTIQFWSTLFVLFSGMILGVILYKLLKRM